MKWTAIATLAALAVYIWVTVNVGKARAKYKVAAPSMDGPQEFQSAYRVQANTAEQMILFLPALWMCAYFLGDPWAAIGGAIWAVGRVLYALGYYKDPPKRELGFVIAMLAGNALIIGTIVGLVIHW